MKSTETFFSGPRAVRIAHCPTPADIAANVNAVLDEHIGDLPKTASILIKPNFHKDLPAVLSNTTDFRLIIAVVRALQNRGYRNILVGEGPACGFDASNIDVFKRLRVHELVEYLGVRCVNFNKCDYEEVQLHNGVVGRVAKPVVDSDYFINLPKLKTHLLAQVSAALKSLVGCFVGPEKRQMHSNLLENIILVNSKFPPNLILVDALVAMEGQGPGIGTPVVLDRIISGSNPYTVDLACTVISGHDCKRTKLIQSAIRQGKLTQDEVSEAARCIPVLHRFAQARPKRMVRLTAVPFTYKLRKYFRWLYASGPIHALLYKLEWAEDVLNPDDGDYRIRFSPQPSRRDSARCVKYCPLAVDRPAFTWPEAAAKDCIGCLYCVFLAQDGAAALDGRPGYLEYLLRHYRPHTTRLA